MDKTIKFQVNILHPNNAETRLLYNLFIEYINEFEKNK